MTSSLPSNTAAAESLPLALGIDFCLRHEMVPERVPAGIVLHFAGEADPEALEWASYLLGVPQTDLEVAPNSTHIERHLAVLRGRRAAEGESGLLAGLSEDDLSVGEGSTLDEIRRKSQAEPVVKLADHIFEEALRLSATDIHLEPDDSGVTVRLRRDGLLREFLVLPRWVQASLTSRVKILAELDIAEKRLPQDGRIQRLWQGESLDVRVSTLPTRTGEKVVLRLLRQDASVVDLVQVGMGPRVRTVFESLCDRPQGMVFVTGPTGSGKSSTLYAALRRILPRDINITTIEDPIEYRLKGANQVQILEKAGLTFAEALRSILRQDPDVILVGEIRDAETAGIAVQAAQTGHLVFSTLHTNDAAGAVTRLSDLGVPRFMVASAVLGVVAQRLVRKICPHCMVWSEPTAEERAAFPAETRLPVSVPRAVGCPACDGTGYKGRTGIFEILVVDDPLREAIVRGEPETAIRKLSGMQPLLLDGLEKVAEGRTTLEEVLRVGLR
ncbi:MAG: type II/IV secretion system protein [Fibrobacterota bacterium]|nr:type II/IV secretion system protein [Fibrobacterota bacterium]QQS04249.1 MAG: type II/IV secretion system protein [Fibrobacterota bacterium]